MTEMGIFSTHGFFIFPPRFLLSLIAPGSASLSPAFARFFFPSSVVRDGAVVASFLVVTDRFLPFSRLLLLLLFLLLLLLLLLVLLFGKGRSD